MKVFRRTAASHGSTSPSRPRTSSRILLLNVIIGILAVVVVVLLIPFLQRTILSPPVNPARADGRSGAIQLDVLNGCGVQGVATSITAYLRARGFDVVEMRNYRSFDMQESLVVDRTGIRQNAEQVAYALGINKRNVIQQINEDYFVDVSVVIGRDYATLKPSH
jgi:hypothetical protein